MIRNNLSWINLNAGSSGGSGGGGVSDYNDLANRPIISMTGTSQNPLKLWNLSTGLYLLNGYVYYNTTNTRECVNLFVSITAQIQNGKYVLSAFVPSWEGHYEYIKANSTSTDYTDTQILKMLTEDDVLTLTNEVEYTPTTDYHPSTKKYVDEAMQSVMEEFAKMGVNEQDIKTLIAENRRRDIAIQALLNETADKNVTIEEDTHTISLDYSMEDGMVTVNSIEGSTLVNVSKTVDEVYATKSQDRVEQSKVANTIGEQNGKLCPIIEGDTLVNVCDQKDPIAITKSYTVENSGNHIALQGEYDGSCRPVIQGNTLVNLCTNGNCVYNLYTENNRKHFYPTLPYELIQGNTYTIIFTLTNCIGYDSSDIHIYFNSANYKPSIQATDGTYVFSNIWGSGETICNIRLSEESYQNGARATISDVMIFEGDLTQTPELIPAEYVEGLKSSFEDGYIPENLMATGVSETGGSALRREFSKNIYKSATVIIPSEYVGKLRMSMCKDNLGWYNNYDITNTIQHFSCNADEYYDCVSIAKADITLEELVNLDIIVLEGDYSHLSPEDFNHLGKYKVEYKVTGKNLFDDNLCEDGILDANGIENIRNATRTKYIKVKPSTDYVLSTPNYTNYLYMHEYNDNLEQCKAEYTLGKDKTVRLFTTSSNTRYIRLNTYVVVNTGERTTFGENVQLEEGSTPTEYEPYKSYTKTFYLNSPLLEGDTIEDVSGVATHVKRYEKVVLNGSENWNIYRNLDGNKTIGFGSRLIEGMLPPNVGKAWDNNICLSNIFLTDKHYPMYTGEDREFLTISSNINEGVLISINKDKLQSQDIQGFKQWLSENPTTVVYELASPIYEPISTESILCDSYVSGHLDFDSAVPIDKVDFRCVNLHLRYLQPNINYTIQFNADNTGVINYYMNGAWENNISVAKGLNKIITNTVDSSLNYNNLDLRGIGFNASNIVVTEATDKDFDYFNGIQSTFEENLVTDENNPHYGKYRVIYRTKSSDGNASTVKSVYLNSPLLQGDKLVVVNGKLCHYHKCGKVVLDGSENWIVINNNIPMCELQKVIEGSMKLTTADTLVSNTLPTAEVYSYNNNIGICGTDGINIRVRLTNNNDTVVSVKQWLQANPTTVVYELASPYYEEISSNPKDTVVDFYANGTLEVQSAVYPLSMEFTSFEEELTYLYASTVYTVQFEANGNATANITLGGATVTNQEITHGLNKIQVTTPSTLIDNKLIIDGCGDCKISKVVVTNSTEEFEYFEGMKSAFEDKQNEDGIYTVEIVVYNAPIRLNKDKE